MPDRSVLGSSPPRACRWAEGPGHGSGGPCSQGRLRLRLRPQLRPRRPARPRPPARSLPGLGEHSIHSPPAAAGRGRSRSRSRSQSQAGPGSRRRRRGDAGERGQAGGRTSRSPGRPQPARRRRADFGPRPASQRGGAAGEGRRGGASTRVARPRAWGQHQRAPEPPAPCVPGLAGGPAPRLGASGASCSPARARRPAEPDPTVRWSGLCSGRACGIFPLLPSLIGLRAARSPWLPRPPPPLGPPPPPSRVPAVSPATSSRRPVGGSSPSSSSGARGWGGALQSRASSVGPLSRRGAPSP